MSDIAFDCPACGQSLEAPEELAGQTIDCPACGQPLTVPAAPADGAPDVADEGPAETAPCPSCGAPLSAGTVLCLQCGFHTGLGKKIDTSFE